MLKEYNCLDDLGFEDNHFYFQCILELAASFKKKIILGKLFDLSQSILKSVKVLRALN